VIALVAAAALAALPARLAVHAPDGGEAPLAQEDRDDAAGPWEDDEEDKPRLRFAAWAGEALASAGSGRGSGFVGGEAAWSFDSLDLGVAGSGYRNLVDATRTWTPVVLARITQRFKTRRGVEAAFGFGAGAGQRRGWAAWYQVALGVRVPLGPLFLGGELAFEQYDLLRLAAGLGVAF
jgi:hypothetical protein